MKYHEISFFVVVKHSPLPFIILTKIFRGKIIIFQTVYLLLLCLRVKKRLHLMFTGLVFYFQLCVVIFKGLVFYF